MVSKAYLGNGGQIVDLNVSSSLRGLKITLKMIVASLVVFMNLLISFTDIKLGLVEFMEKLI